MNTLVQRYPDGFWDAAADELSEGYLLQHNDDYLEFLVQRVWKLHEPCRLVEMGCGAGKMGKKLLPLLPPGSSYTGIDQSAALIAKARQVFAGAPFPTEFHAGSLYATPFPADSFDVALTHTVLMHIPDPGKALAEMIRVTRSGGMLITCEANRNAHAALLHIPEVNHQEASPLELFQTINREILRRTGVDHNIGIKMPVLMHAAGLVNVQARMADTVRCLFPPLETAYQHQLFTAICHEGYGAPQPDAEQRARHKAALLNFGISDAVAEYEIEREIAEDFLTKGRGYHTVYPGLLTWTSGEVRK